MFSIYQIELMPEGEIAMTREAILKEIQLLPDDVLEAIWNMVKVASAIPQNTISKQDDQKTLHKFRTAGALDGKIIIHDDFDEPLEDMKEYM